MEAITFKDKNGITISQVFLAHPDNPQKQIEVYWSQPEIPGPRPVIIFIHGHQETNKIGGRASVDDGSVGRFTESGYVCASISQPGYGNSDGPPDFCGPFSQNALVEAIRYLRANPSVNPSKIMLYGFSRGAIVASMVATMDDQLAAVILVGGIYDFKRGLPTGNKGLDEYWRSEAGTDEQSRITRSAMYHVDKINCAVLLLHGEDDDRFSAKLVEEFAQKLRKADIPVEIEVFPDTGHRIPPHKRLEITRAFRSKYLGQ